MKSDPITKELFTKLRLFMIIAWVVIAIINSYYFDWRSITIWLATIVITMLNIQLMMEEEIDEN